MKGLRADGLERSHGKTLPLYLGKQGEGEYDILVNAKGGIQ